jgi:uncharacterized protein (TIGR03435 family)
MTRPVATATFAFFSALGILAQPTAFEVSTIKSSNPTANGMSFGFRGPRRFTANNHTLKECIAFAYNMSTKLISGGPAWIESDRYDIVGEVPSETQPPMEQAVRMEQAILMFQALLTDRFQLNFHREPQERAVYNLILGKSELKLKESALPPDRGQGLMFRPAAPHALTLPARNATMAGFTSLLQRAILDRPVLDRTGLTGRYDFDLTWRIDGTQQDRGSLASADVVTSDKPDIFAAIRELGLRLEPAKAQVDIIVIDHVERPDEN